MHRAKPIDKAHHVAGGEFREQISALYFTGTWCDSTGVEWATFVKELRYVCQPGAASLDPDNPGADTNAAWEAMDGLIENERVRGFYHTHPQGAEGFSVQDMMLIKGFAQANGERYLWHVVHPVDSPIIAVCANMRDGQVFLFRFGKLKGHQSHDMTLLLPMPIEITSTMGMLALDI